MQLGAGEHTLEVQVSDAGLQHSIWAVSGAGARTIPIMTEPEMRLVMPASNQYVHVAGFSLRMLRQFWPSYPEIDVIRYESGVVAGPYRQLYAGRQSAVCGLRLYAATFRR